MIDDEKKHWSVVDREEMIAAWLKLGKSDTTTFLDFRDKWLQKDAPQEKQLTDEYFCSYCCAGIPPCTCPKAQAQPTSETYDQGRFIIVQDGDDEAFKNGNYYTAHLYFNSVQEWEIKEEYNTYLIR